MPAAFSEINTVSALCEIVAMRDDLIPDVSLGTHYFSDLVETGILYLALYPSRQDNRLNADGLGAARNRLAEVAPDAERWADVVRVVDAPDLAGPGRVLLNANALTQTVVCYVDRSGKD